MKFRQETLVDRVILKPFVLGKKSAGGIVLPTNQRMAAVNSDKGTVFMIGPEAWSQYDKKPVKVGDTVFYAKYGAKVLNDPDVEDSFCILCNAEDILVGYKS